MLFIAQGFGIGRIPFAPGTWGSVVGVVWFALLLATGKLWVLIIGSIAGVALSVWLGDVAEKVLGQKDPGSVVLDEIAAMPVCFFAWLGILVWRNGTLPAVQQLVSKGNWPVVLGVFAAFRFFDILKPWPVRQSQSLPGGWGITVDDLLAAVYVNGTMLVVYLGRTILLR
jgi:phosphatidylglycerophosphatase A